MGLLDALNSFFSTKEALNLSSLLSCGNCWYSGYNVKGKCTRKNPPQPILTASQANLCDAFTVEAPQTTTTARLDVLAAKTDMVKGAVDAVEVVTAPLSAKLDTLATKTDAVKASADLIKTATDESKASIEAMNTDVKGKLDLVKTSTDTIQTKTDLVKAAVDPLAAKLDASNTKLDTVAGNVSTVGSKTDLVKTAVDTSKTAIDLVTVAANNTKTAVDTTKAAVDSAKTAIDQNKAAIQALPTTIKTISEGQMARGGSGSGVYGVTYDTYTLVKSVTIYDLTTEKNADLITYNCWQYSSTGWIKITCDTGSGEVVLAEHIIPSTVKTFYSLPITPRTGARVHFYLYLKPTVSDRAVANDWFQIYGTTKQVVTY